MLDRLALIKKISGKDRHLWIDRTEVRKLARDFWQKLIADRGEQEKLLEIKSSLLTAFWHGEIGLPIKVESAPSEYSICAVDGSQTYPDRHLIGPACFLINTGRAFFSYGQKHSTAQLENEPYLFLKNDMIDFDESLSFTPDLIDAQRELMELQLMVKSAEFYQESSPWLLLDGSIIFWHLQSKPELLAKKFLGNYLASMMKMSQQSWPYASYISAPQSCELINLVKTFACTASRRQRPCLDRASLCCCVKFEAFFDRDLLDGWLKPGERTRLFTNRASIVESYPASLRPRFFYLHVGSEIARVELPAYLAQDKEMVNRLAAVLLDQVEKGGGYPISLAEAHEQAVIKTADADFFVQQLINHAQEKGLRVDYSPKRKLKIRPVI